VPHFELSDEALGLRGHLVIDRVAGGLCMGGLRVSPGVSVDTLTRLARLMSLKFGVLGVRIGGAKAGIVAGREPGDGALLRRAAELLEPHLRAGYLMGEDLGTTGAEIAAMYAHVQVDPVAVVRSRAPGRAGPGPPGPSLGDLFGDRVTGEVAGAGAAAAARAAAESLGLRLDRCLVAVQGYGSVGRSAAHRLAELGATVVAVADVEGTICAPGGLALEDLDEARDARGRIDRRRLRRPATLLPGADWCRLPVDVLVPAAVEDAITAEQAGRLHRRVRLIVEAANAPVPEAVEAALQRRGVVIVPDFVASAGTAGVFGLLATGRAAALDDVIAECTRRIAAATAQVVGGEGTARERATKLAETTFRAE
jgi:glutamate dehydrogenase (NAD(P)+)